ncbi:hypothetical protein F400_gp004 [Bacillus phage BCD7]|uniref:Uncharacterized protein n=1 Tax=Bacillus phage BCD7 TaxID=1136534 RepID=J9PUK4_9CAUD|nr:hypothetical protein F400_gp004 [Bacillus phage BCD7]AEZ50451.1 hypothetical protein BCD7_0004 [Bacillus phage BCD7]
MTYIENVDFTFVNPNDIEYFDTSYIINYHNDKMDYIVYANCEQDALDALIDFLVAREETGLLYTREIIEEWNDDIDDYVSAGNEGRYYVCTAYLRITKRED